MHWNVQEVYVPRIPAADPGSSCHYTVLGPETSNLQLSVRAREKDLNPRLDGEWDQCIMVSQQEKKHNTTKLNKSWIQAKL